MQSAEKNVETQSPIAMNKVPFSNTANRIAGNTQPHNPPPQYISTAKLATNQQTQIEVDEPPSSCGMYTKEALEAVGLGYSPSTIQPNPIRSKTLEDVTFEQYRASRQTQSPLQVQTPSSTRTEPKRYQRAVELPPPPPPKILEPPKQMDTIDFNIVRCWDLPESLGGTNPYVLLNNPSFGQAKTACVFNSTQPYFGSILSLNCPKQAWKRENGNDDLVNFDGMEASVVQIFVYNKNQSISDEMIAYGEHDLMAMVGVKHSIIVDLYDSNRNPTGYVEIAARYRE